MKIIVLLLLIFVSPILDVADGNANSLGEECTGIWAVGAKLPFSGGDAANPLEIISPSGALSISGSTEGLSLVSERKAARLDILINPPLMEVLWAPDSQKFVINISEGGLVGGWETHLFLINDSGLPIPIDLKSSITPIANKILQCESGEEANLGIAAWLNDSKEVLLILEVPPHSSCRNMGEITGFRISIETGKIVERISEVELMRNWRSVLGCRFEYRLHAK